MRKKLIAGNWKMHKGLSESRELALAIAKGLEKGPDPEVVLFPSFVSLAAVVEAVAGAAHPIAVGAQNLYPQPEGAFTGEVSARMVRSAGASHVLAGHSERRTIFAETDDLVGQKVRAALDLGLTPILCVGEKLEEREAGDTLKVVSRQLRGGLDRLEKTKVARVVLAYEPVWAIGTGQTATPQQGAEVHRALRAELTEMAGAQAAQSVRILYGGSVKPDNIRDLLAEPEIDGALVGGASLEAGSFLAICRAGKRVA